MTFNQNDYDAKLTMIRKHYRDSQLFLETYLDDYCGYHIYFRIDYIKSDKVYRLRWFDLDTVLTSRLSIYESSEVVAEQAVLDLILLASVVELPAKLIDSGKDNNVSFYMAASTKNAEFIDIKFYKYIPEELFFLKDVFTLIFRFLPKRLEAFLGELCTNVCSTSEYDYKEKFTFDLFKDDLNKLFSEAIVERGEKYYAENRVFFLEKVDDRYFAVVNGEELYLVVIQYDEKIKEVEVYCSCPCEFFCKHMYAVFKAIRAKKYKPFYKVMKKDEKSSNLLDVMSNFNYTLTIGMVEDVLGIIGDDGIIEWVPILNEKRLSDWIVVEDDAKGRLAYGIKALINGD